MYSDKNNRLSLLTTLDANVPVVRGLVLSGFFQRHPDDTNIRQKLQNGTYRIMKNTLTLTLIIGIDFE